MFSRFPPLVVALVAIPMFATGCGDDGGGSGDENGTSTDSTDETASTDPTDTTMGTTTGPSTTDPTDPTTETEGTPGIDAFRFTEIFVRDPHFFISPVIGCDDITDMGIAGQPGVNEQFNQGIGADMDDPPDGILDLSFMLLFRPLDQAGGGGDVDFASGECLVPAQATQCDLKPMSTSSMTMYVNDAAANCLDPDPTETSTQNYTPAIQSTTPPCFSAGPVDLTLAFDDFPDLPLQGATLAAQYMGDDDLIEGLLRGFLSEEDADNATLPADLPLIGGEPISLLLPGGTGNCAGHDDKDMNNGTPGWWIYANFKAQRVPYTGQ